MTSMQGVHDFTLDARETSARFTGMKYIYGGTFDMGMAGIAEPVHKVTLSPFYIDSTEVTQADYKALIGSDPSQYANHPLNPVEEVTMFDIVLYCNERSKREGRDTVYTYTAKTGTPQIGLQNLDNFVIYYDRAGYRLPTEAEWEYACRAGSGTKFYWGDVPSLDYCWAQNNAGGHTNQVATKKANAWGLYDMIGNDWEYCTDLDTVYTSASQTDPVGAATGWRRQLRGGAWHEAYDHPWMYCANRHSEVPTCRDNNVGFRCVFPDM
jgi:formylglycine-generating enzyme required for sulfatase activity